MIVKITNEYRDMQLRSIWNGIPGITYIKNFHFDTGKSM
jgi:hypothetical protein